MDTPLFDPYTYALVMKQVDKLKQSEENKFPTAAITDLNLDALGMQIGFFANTATNAPVASAGLLIHYASSENYGAQLALLVGSNGLYTRGKSSGTWGDWKKITTAT